MSSESIRWISKFPDLLQITNGNILRREGPPDEMHCSITNHPIAHSKNQYFEITIKSARTSLVHNLYQVAVGVAPDTISLKGWPGNWSELADAYAYHGDDGKFHHQRTSNTYGPSLKVDDVVGCGIENGSLFYTLNGNHLGIAKLANSDANASRLDSNCLYPVIGLKSGLQVDTNFGEKNFLYLPYNQCELPMLPKTTFSEEYISDVQDFKERKEDTFYDHLTDVTIVSKDGQEIRCHRIFLSIRSRVFKAMFKIDNDAHTITIEDFEAVTIRQMLRFIYTDSLSEEEQSCIDFDLLAIANKYDINPLKSICEENLCQDVGVDNVLDAWRSANFLESQSILDFCETFVKAHWTAVKKSEGYDKLMRENGADLAKLFSKVMDKVLAP